MTYVLFGIVNESVSILSRRRIPAVKPEESTEPSRTSRS
jgi:hypothetical protein